MKVYNVVPVLKAESHVSRLDRKFSSSRKCKMKTLISRKAISLCFLSAVAIFSIAGAKATFAQDHITIKSYPAGAFATGWTHSVNTPNGILWYNSQTGAGAVGLIDSAGNHTTVKSYPAGAFATGWTLITNTPSGILYYNTQTGAGAVGLIDSAGNHTTVKSYPAGAFATGWTHNVNTPNGILWYNAQTGAGAFGQIR